MIARACIETGLPPEVFGVASSPELGAEILAELADRARADRLAAMRARHR